MSTVNPRYLEWKPKRLDALLVKQDIPDAFDIMKSSWNEYNESRLTIPKNSLVLAYEHFLHINVEALEYLRQNASPCFRTIGVNLPNNLSRTHVHWIPGIPERDGSILYAVLVSDLFTPFKFESRLYVFFSDKPVNDLFEPVSRAPGSSNYAKLWFNMLYDRCGIA